MSRPLCGREYAEDETEETGWNAFEARMYDPVIGRWISIDPARQYFSPYLSMRNNPMIIVDPDGRYDNPKNFFQRAWNTLTFRGGLNKSYSIRVNRFLTPKEIEKFDNLKAAGLLDGPKLLNPRGEFRKFGIFPTTPAGSGFEASLFLGPGGAVSIDRIEDADGGNDLYLSFSGGGGVDVSAEVHANMYQDGNIPSPESIVGLSYFWSLSYAAASFQQSGTIDFSSGRIEDYNLFSPGLGIGTPYLIGGGKVGLTYTWNLSDIARMIQGYPTRSYH